MKYEPIVRHTIKQST